MDEKQVVDCNIDFIRSSNCLPTTKQLAQALGASEAEIDKFKQENATYAEFIKVRKRFTSSDEKRKKGFGSFEAFYKWYAVQGNKCYYCHSTQKELDRLFDDELVSSKKFGATLHIERKHPDKGYAPQNCVLACSLCNNAKSDMISAENFEGYFGEPIRKFISDLLNDKITNQIKKDKK